jgi:hypothetical protein
MCGRKKVYAAEQVEKEKVPEVVVKSRVSYSSKAQPQPSKMGAIAPDTCCVTLRFEIPQDLMERQIQNYRNIEEKLIFFGMASEEDGRKDLQTVREEIALGLYTLFLNRDPLRIPMQYEGAVTIVKK